VYAPAVDEDGAGIGELCAVSTRCTVAKVADQIELHRWRNGWRPAAIATLLGAAR
jgi:hypothetical protein